MLAFLALLIASLLVLLALACVRLGVSRRAHWCESEKGPGAKAFDVSTISPQIQRVRRNFVPLAHSRFRPSFNRTEWLATARRMVTSFSYFREKEEHEPAK